MKLESLFMLLASRRSAWYMRAMQVLRTGFAAAFLLAMLTGPVLAGQLTQLNVNGGPIVPGAAPLPEFHLGFILDDPARHSLTPDSGNLEMTLSLPDSGVLRFLFSPRPQIGLNLDQPAAGRGYAGLTWNLFGSGNLFGHFGLAGSYDPMVGTLDDPLHRALAQPLLLHGALEFGYHISERHSLSLSLDQGRIPDQLRQGGETSDNLRLRYGLKF
jgi:hypothetical protein